MDGHSTIKPTDPMVILAGIKQFGLASDGSDLRDLQAAIERLYSQLGHANSLTRQNDGSESDY